MYLPHVHKGRFVYEISILCSLLIASTVNRVAMTFLCSLMTSPCVSCVDVARDFCACACSASASCWTRSGGRRAPTTSSASCCMYHVLCLQRERELLDTQRRPTSADDFERLVLLSPDSSMVWLRYMAHALERNLLEKARAIAERALDVISFRSATLSHVRLFTCTCIHYMVRH